MRQIVVGIVAVVGVVAIGCGGPSPAPAKAAPGGRAAASPAPVKAALPPPSADALLTVTDVEKVLGVRGVQVVPRMSKPGAGGDVNFVLANGDLVLMANFSPADPQRFNRMYDHYRVKDVPGVGDQAFYGPPGATQYLLAFRKGDRVVSINTFFSMDAGPVGQPMMSEAQLTQVAQLIASRM